MLGKAVFHDGYNYECYAEQEKTNVDMHASSIDGLEPPTYFRMALVKCISAYILDFCKSREIDTAGIGIEVNFATDEFSVKEIDNIHINISLPESFPEKYKRAINSLISHCRIINVLSDPPDVFWKIGESPVVDMHFHAGVELQLLNESEKN
jgi:uncharacterized OsmC-like protein